MADFEGHTVERIVILTGAGISAESGLATFRDSDGLWEKHDPMEIATPEAFARDPELVYRFYNARRNQLADVAPNAAHRALAKLQAEFSGDVFLITQNVDDLHERGGSQQVCHMHGQLRSALCTACSVAGPVAADYSAITPCPACGVAGHMRPDIVWFGEMPYYMAEIEQHLRACDLFIAIGTSGLVYPAAGFVREATQAGARAVEVNKEASDVAGYFHSYWLGPATRQVPQLVEHLLGY